MAADPANIRVAVSGIVSVAPTGTTAPTDATTALNVAFTDVGEIGEDGVEESWDDSQTDIRNNAGVVVRRIISESAATIQFTMLETSSTTLELYYKGSTVTGSGPYSIDIQAPQADPRSFVLDTLEGGIPERLYIPSGEVTARGPITYAANGAKQYQVTVTAYPDDTGTIAKKFSSDTAWA
jgi:hypothetical protein